MQCPVCHTTGACFPRRDHYEGFCVNRDCEYFRCLVLTRRPHEIRFFEPRRPPRRLARKYFCVECGAFSYVWARPYTKCVMRGDGLPCRFTH
ncbi:hypothetical protein R5R35_007348 [Gryllus longicercus]|nr:Protein of unknown function [Gryllus bimaculatus]